jgi:anti-repressor protein
MSTLTISNGGSLISVKGVRGYLDQNGTAWLNLEDVARGLGFTQKKNGVEYVRWETVRGYISEFGFSQQVGKGFIPENIFYRLAMKAKNETAETFQAKVADEILPSIRKHGAYMTSETIEKALTSPDFLIQLATKLKEEQEARRALEKQIEQDKPYTNFAKSIANSSDAITFGEFAKILNNNGIKIGRNRLFDWMRKNGFLIQSGREKNKPKQQYVEQGLFQVKESVIHTIDKDLIRTTTLITGKGQLYFLEKLKEEHQVETNTASCR